MITDKMLRAAVAAYGRRPAPLFGVDVRRLKATLEAAEAAAWQPRETAPKDGTFLILHYESGVPIEIRQWGLGIRIGDEERLGWLCQRGHLRVDQPVHWRPLPAGPKAA